MSLSKETIDKLADALLFEVIDYINSSPKKSNFLYELVGDAVCDKLGNTNPDGSCSFDGSQLAPAVLDKMTLSLNPTFMPSDPATL